MKAILMLALNLAVVGGVGAGGAWLTQQGLGTWYRSLRKPAWTPPNWLFGPVWTTVFVLMAVGAWLVLAQGWERPGVKLAIALYGVQLVLNLAWSGLFFALRSPGAAAVEILLLLTSVAAMIAAFWQVSPLAASLQLPYLAWGTFATALNLSIVALNQPRWGATDA